jgi:hypothetical protein
MWQWYIFTFNATVCGPGCEGPQTVALKVKEAPLPHYTLGILMMN